MKTKFKTLSKKKKAKSIKWFGIYWWKVNNLKEYYKLKYPKLFPETNKKKTSDYLNNKNFRNSQNYIVWDFIKHQLDKESFFSKSFLNSFFYSLFIFSLIWIWFTLWKNQFLFFSFLWILSFTLFISLLSYFYKKLNKIKEDIIYKNLWKKYKSDSIFFRIKIREIIYKNDFLIIKNK
jgi:hypothetical protein